VTENAATNMRLQIAIFLLFNNVTLHRTREILKPREKL